MCALEKSGTAAIDFSGVRQMFSQQKKEARVLWIS